jgi:DNA primase
MKEQWVDFRAIKQFVSMEMALRRYGVSLRKVSGSYRRGRCPLPGHRSKDSRQSFIVNTSKNAWVCHSASCAASRGGQIGGNVLDFVASMENCTIRDAALKLQDGFSILSASSPAKSTHSPALPKRVFVPPTCEEPNPALAFTLTGVDCHHPYLAERGISPHVAHQFGVGFYGSSGLMQNRVVFPIHDDKGILVAYAGRAVGQDEPRYKFPAGFRKSLALFNLHRAASCGKRVVVVEGFFDCLKVHQANVPCVVALMGCSLSQRQEELLAHHFQEIILMLDGDKAGRAAGATMAARLCMKISTRLVEIPFDSQPDQLGADQIRCFCIPGYF